MPASIAPYAKFYVGLIAAVATSLLTVLTPESPAYDVVTIVVAVAGAIGVYLVPNVDEPVE